MQLPKFRKFHTANANKSHLPLSRTSAHWHKSLEPACRVPPGASHNRAGTFSVFRSLFSLPPPMFVSRLRLPLHTHSPFFVSRRHSPVFFPSPLPLFPFSTFKTSVGFSITRYRYCSEHFQFGAAPPLISSSPMRRCWRHWSILVPREVARGPSHAISYEQNARSEYLPRVVQTCRFVLKPRVTTTWPWCGPRHSYSIRLRHSYVIRLASIGGWPRSTGYCQCWRGVTTPPRPALD